MKNIMNLVEREVNRYGGFDKYSPTNKCSALYWSICCPAALDMRRERVSIHTDRRSHQLIRELIVRDAGNNKEMTEMILFYYYLNI